MKKKNVQIQNPYEWTWLKMLPQNKRYTVATLFFLALFVLFFFFYSFFFFFFNRTTLQPALSYASDLYIQVKPSPILSPPPPPPPHQPPPPPPQFSSTTSSAGVSVADHESVDVTDSENADDAGLGLKGCDLYTGTWVEDESYPIYEIGSCPYVDEAYDCKNNGRSDTHYTQWRWQPYGCDLPRFVYLSNAFLKFRLFFGICNAFRLFAGSCVYVWLIVTIHFFIVTLVTRTEVIWFGLVWFMATTCYSIVMWCY